MTKIKVIKRNEGGEKTPPPAKASSKKPKKQRSMESTVKDWITERRENDDAETRDRNSQLDSWSEDFHNPTEPV
ncbi:MAG: hypothetical protein ABIO91_08900 [Pyrinomonadaceae bacterium]